MTNRNLLLGRSKPSGKLTRAEIAAIDKVTVSEPRTQPAPKAEKVTVSNSALTFRWTAPCPICGHKAGGNRIPKSGQSLAKCGGYCRVIHLA